MDRFRESKKANQTRRQSREMPGIFSNSPERPADQSPSHSPYPSSARLPEPPLHKQVSSIRKYQEAQQKLRQKQAAYHHLIDMYDKVTKQKQGIETSLMHQIDMYRNLIKEIEEKAEERLRKIQQAFKQEMERKMAEKEDEMRVMQGEKEELEQFVQQLQKIGDELENKLAIVQADLRNNQQNLRRSQQQIKSLHQRFEQSQQNAKIQSQRQQEMIEGLRQKIIETERQWRDRLQQSMKDRERALKQLEKQYKQEIARINEKHQSEKNDRKDEIKGLMQGYETEKNRLNQVIASKERAIEQFHKEQKQSIEKLNQVIRGYQQQIQSLSNEKSRLFQEVDSLNAENTHLNVLIKDLQMSSLNQKKNLEAYITKLKQDINYSQTNFLRERDRNVIHYEDSTKQLISLKKQVARLQSENEKLTLDSSSLVSEVRSLRDMLLESSYQLEKCKQEFVKLSKERDYMAIRLNESAFEVGTLKRIKNEREDEARTWRDSYYLHRSRSIRR